MQGGPCSLGSSRCSPSRARTAAGATIKYGPFQLSGSLQSQNLIRHPDIDSYNITQQRNTARLQLEYKWLENGKFIDKYDIPFIDRSSLFVLYRGVYDSIYDFTPGFIEKDDIHGDAYGGLNALRLRRSSRATRSGSRSFARNALHDQRPHARASATRSSSTTSCARPTST